MRKRVKKIVRHLKDDAIHNRKLAKHDDKLMKSIKDAHKAQNPTKKAKRKKVEKVMREYKKGELHSGSKRGPKVTNPKQAVAIAYSEARHMKKKKKK